MVRGVGEEVGMEPGTGGSPRGLENGARDRVQHRVRALGRVRTAEPARVFPTMLMSGITVKTCHMRQLHGGEHALTQ